MNEDDFLKHIASHVSPRNNYACFNCDKKFDSSDILFKHIKETYTKTEIECVCCMTYFASKVEFEEHKCEKTVNFEELGTTLTEWREMEYITEWNIEH